MFTNLLQLCILEHTGRVIGVLQNRLREIRFKEYAASSTDFAKKLGVSISVYSAWERGKTFPSLEKAYDVAKRLDRTVIDIWYEE